MLVSWHQMAQKMAHLVQIRHGYLIVSEKTYQVTEGRRPQDYPVCKKDITKF